MFLILTEAWKVCAGAKFAIDFAWRSTTMPRYGLIILNGLFWIFDDFKVSRFVFRS